ncbi:inositol monophosphatase family protein [Nocardia mangyaensis]|uniref:inositol monophosphatase family protein n=1 Tax=Nocardia mangyaensis TaxID=2213200 RepID=UPI002676685E|nr:inositol monophosphatase family protein [Nocardia mangyaensis]MDO3650848.1 inositol monophosphatase family protein [Nocardia mangyaensis]
MIVDSVDVLTLAREAAAVGANMLASARPSTVRLKGDRDYVTDLDLEIERTVRGYLAAATPSFSFLGEESAGYDSDSEYRWVLDPIDGTSNFVHGIPLCAVSLALLHGDKTVVASIVAPFLGQAFHASKGGGSYANDEQIFASGAREISSAMVSIGDYAVGQDAPGKNLERLKVTAALAGQAERVRMLGAASLDLAWLAQGRTDACVILANKPWDTAAGVLLAREAGAVINDTRGAPHSLSALTTVGCASAELALSMVDLLTLN